MAKPKIVKTLSIISLFVSVVALGLASFVLYDQRDLVRVRKDEIGPAAGGDPKRVVLQILDRPRWDGTDAFFAKHRNELKTNVEIVNLFETDGVGIAFVRSSAHGRKFQFCIWLRKADEVWREVGYLSAYSVSDDPFRGKWIERNEKWLAEMSSKKKEWEKQSDSAW